MNSVREILDAIRALPRPERLRLMEQLQGELSDQVATQASPPPVSEFLEERGRFLVYTGQIKSADFDHRADREERVTSWWRGDALGR